MVSRIKVMVVWSSVLLVMIALWVKEWVVGWPPVLLLGVIAVVVFGWTEVWVRLIMWARKWRSWDGK